MTNKTEELVVLVDENDNALGTTPKATVHHAHTPLHRAFSVYIFSLSGKVLVQQRHSAKKTWGGFWSNSCCGHPSPEETHKEAVVRRVKQELGIDLMNVEKVEPYRYRFEHAGYVENEVCPILVATTKSESVMADPSEVDATRWLSWSELIEDMSTSPSMWSPWSLEQVEVLNKSEKFRNWLTNNKLSLLSPH